MRVKSDRSFVLYIILCVVTLGIYGLIFWHNYVKDVNIVCAGDGRHTNGLLVAILLSIITLGIYYWIWIYGMQTRLQDTAYTYRIGGVSSGGSVLLWYIVGVLLFCIGPFIALYKQIDSMNRVADAYNTMSMRGMRGGMQINNYYY